MRRATSPTSVPREYRTLPRFCPRSLNLTVLSVAFRTEQIGYLIMHGQEPLLRLAGKFDSGHDLNVGLGLVLQV